MNWNSTKRMGLGLLIGSTLVLLNTSFNHTAAQQVTSSKTVTELKVQAGDAVRAVKISFKTLHPVTNLLVRVTGNNGQTVFLDNKYRFSGDYASTVDLSTLAHGEYIVEISAGKEKYKSKVEIK